MIRRPKGPSAISWLRQHGEYKYVITIIFLQKLAERQLVRRLNQKIIFHCSRFFLHEVCNKFVGPIPASLVSCNTAPSEEMLQRWRAVGNNMSDLTSLRFEPQTSRFRDERVTAQPTGQFGETITLKIKLGSNTLLIMQFFPNSVPQHFHSWRIVLALDKKSPKKNYYEEQS